MRRWLPSCAQARAASPRGWRARPPVVLASSTGVQYLGLPSNNDDPGDHGLTVPETVLTSVVTSGRLLLQGSNGPTTLAAVFRTWEHGSE